MKHALLFFFSLCCSCGMAQNLVPNPSFEEYTECPTGWASFAVQNWFRTNGTPDYYNSCSNNGCFGGGIPCNQTGFQYAKDGNAYVGLATYQTGVLDSREFVGIELISPLEQGKRYIASMYVSLATFEFNGEPPLIACASNNIGFRFADVIGDNGSGANLIPVNNIAQVYCDTVISDTLNWIRVSGSFIADSSYRYLLIGNHFDDAHTEVNCLSAQQYVSAYYYIDAVSVSTDSTVGISDMLLNRERIEIYPNPANNTVYLNQQSTVNYIIVDALGRVVQSENNLFANQINIENIPNGIYFLIINKRQTQRISIFHNN